MDDLIKLEHITIRSEQYEVLRDIELSFPKGESTVIVGPAGCGKSTLLKAAAGILLPDSGTLWFDGRDFFKIPETEMKGLRRDNGFVFQDSALWDNRTLFENLALPLEFHFPELEEKEVAKRVEDLLEKTALHAQAFLRPAQLSTGERKIASYLRALVTQPSLLFMDEPTQSVDMTSAKIIYDSIRDLKDSGCTLIVITHDPALTSWLADYLVVLEEGKVLDSGPFDVVKNSSNPAVRSILSSVLAEAASFDTDILGLLDED